ncbi:hypothetical protein AAFF_G00142540 [Aldrovandia affinis]|uniref:Uncharacterized protein n=1 Tax=Aldrovandia affinis TaxID=143900 RepID=A0AAD7WWP7_9TELE|nr:hypothetical protein AAFF_G00142540 [Aldrovandia affinis]
MPCRGGHAQQPAASTVGQLVPTVATLRTVDGEAGCLPLSPAQVQEAQERDAALTHVQSWLAAGKQPPWTLKQGRTTLSGVALRRGTAFYISAVAGPWPRG